MTALQKRIAKQLRLIVAALGVLTAPHARSFATPAQHSSALGVLSMDDIRRGGAGGTGCGWMTKSDPRERFAMADNRAVARIGGKLVFFAPKPNSLEAFPFTYNEWTDTDVTIAIHRRGPFRRSGEAMIGRADLHLYRKGSNEIVEIGNLSCGS